MFMHVAIHLHCIVTVLVYLLSVHAYLHVDFSNYPTENVENVDYTSLGEIDDDSMRIPCYIASGMLLALSSYICVF